MYRSKIHELWKGGERKVLNKLRFLDLSYSMLRTFDLRATPYLEVLHLKGCTDLVELQFPFECLNLKVLNLSGSKVINLNLGKFPPLKELNLKGCSDVEELHMPNECPSLKILNLSNSNISNINLGLAPLLERLYLSGCSNLRELHAPVGCLEKLVHFQFDNYLYFANFEVNVHELANPNYVAKYKIDAIYVVVCPVHPKTKLPRFKFECKYDEPRSSWSGNLEKLISFGPCVCKNLEYILATICDLQHLRELTLDGGIPQDLWRLQSLEKLCLFQQEFQHLPNSIFMLKHLKSLQLFFCEVLEQINENICELWCLEELLIPGCESLRDIPDNICKMKSLKMLDLSYCDNILKLPEELGSLECLKALDINGTSISGLPQSIYQLKGLCIDGSRKQLESYGFTSILEYSGYVDPWFYVVL